MVNKKLLISLAIVFCVVALTAAYRRPYVWWPVNDMNEQPIMKPYHIEGLREPVAGTEKAVGAWDPVPPRLEVLQKMHPDFTNPTTATQASVANGEALFNIYCTPCHSQGLSTDPNLTPEVVKKGMPPGQNLVRISMLTDAEIFTTISQGAAIMRRMDYHLSPEERWDVVNYIRGLIDTYKAEQP